uniref:Uncharacterized protein n=1 Tax=Hyaloperonospora arabidopsidis (strain Emoy2) TaxID=559515 RepID=M4C1J4_HYAAE
MSVRGPRLPMPDRGEAECTSGTANQLRAPRYPQRATEAIHTGVQPAGYDERSHALLYSIHVLGMSTAEPTFIRSAIMAAMSAPIVSLESVEPDGAAGFGCTNWRSLLRLLSTPRSSNVHEGAPDLLAAPPIDAKRLASLRERLAPELLPRLRDQNTALSQEETRRQSKSIAREAVRAARLRNVEVQKKRADIEQKRQHAEEVKAQEKAVVLMQVRSLRYISKPTTGSSETKSTSAAPKNTSNAVNEEEIFWAEHRGDVTTTSRGSDDGTAGDPHASTEHDVETPLAADANDTTLASTTIIESPPETLVVSIRTMDDTMWIVDLAHDTASPADSDCDDGIADSDVSIFSFPRALEATFEHELPLNSEGGSENVSVKGPSSLDPATTSSEAQKAQRHANTHVQLFRIPSPFLKRGCDIFYKQVFIAVGPSFR